MTMIRAIKTDHDIDPEWSRLGFHVVLDITLTCLYFATYILEFKIGFDHGLQLVNDVSVFNGILAHFLSIFYLFFGLFLLFFCIFGHLGDNQANFCPFFPIYR